MSEDSVLADDPALAAAVREIEAHLAGDGWDQPSRLFALVDTGAFVADEPALAEAMGLGAPTGPSLTPIEQELAGDVLLEQVLESITWPAGVAGCAVVVERLVLPPEADAELPEDPDTAVDFARSHPQRQEVRIVAGATRAGATYCALRMRAHDEDHAVVTGPDLVPGLLELLASTMQEEPI